MANRLARQHLVEHDAERPDIGLVVDLLSPRQLGRHVGDGADRGAGLGHSLGACELGQTEIEDLHDVALGNQQIGRPDVPVHDARIVRFCEPRCYLYGHLDGVCHGDRAALEPLLDRLSLVERHDEAELSVRQFLDRVDRADVGMVEGRGGLGFP